MPNNLQIIKKAAFKGCNNLKSVTIPAAVEFIYQEAFANCYGLEKVNALPSSPPFLYDNSFSDYSVPLIVPEGCVEAYSTAQGWKNFSNISEERYKLTYLVDGEEYRTYLLVAGAAITPEPEPEKEGYTFSGWSEIPATMPAHDVTVTGTFSINTYKLTYVVDGQTYKTYDVEYGATITPDSAPEKEGYTFSGWSEIPATMPAHDVTVTGTFSINTYKLTYVLDGQTYKTYDVEYGAAITPEEELTKEGYTFSGWSEIPETMPAHDVIITGTFTVNRYKLTYMVDGEEYKSYEVEFGTTITPEPAPEKEGYTFSGWSEKPATMPAHDLIVTGTFSINTYKLTYVVDGQTYKTYDVEYGATITPEAEPTKEGYTFSGWSEIPTTMPAHDVTVTGTFSINTYKLTYVVDGQTYKTYDVEYGAAITPEPTPEKEGYTFSGWNSLPEIMPAHDVTVTGTFSINTYKLTYMVDGQTYKTYDVEYGANISPEAEPTKEGYTFSGWSNIPSTMPAHDVTVTGTFSINTYKLTYMVDGQTYKTYDVEYGASITPEPTPTKEGYTFSGWSEIPTTMPAHDVTVTGSFSINKYKLTYVVDGQTYKTYDVEYGAAITPEPAPTKEGYTFSGWSEIPATMPAHDVTVTGTFTKGNYKLTYLVDGEVYKTVSYDYGDVITPEPAPVREGYTFSGWSEIPETMPAHDVTVTGTFSINSYKLTYVVDGQTYKTYDVEYGAVITPEAEPTKEGYTFSGWSEIPATMPAHDVTVTGTFSINTYKLTYVVDGQTYKTYDVEYGAAITPEPAPEKEGYTFLGWSEIPETMPAHDVTVTGSFSINTYKLTYMVDGEEYKIYELEYGAAITPEAEPTKDGYTFSGWSEIPATMPAHDVTVTGTFSIITYKLIYVVDGQTYKTYDVEYGISIRPEPEPEKEGYTFSGWIGLPEIMPAHDVTVTGTFSINTYKLTYVVDGQTYKTYELEYGTAITPESEPTKEGYTFSGWSEIPVTMPAHDVTVTGTFTANKYKLTYMVDGEEYKSYEVEFGTTIIPEAEPTKEGYTFSGWDGLPEIMPAHDVTVTGTFSINSYKLTYMIDNEVYKEVMYEYGATIVPEPQPDGDYISFEWVGLPETMPANDVTVYAVYETGILDIMTLQGIKAIYSPNGKKLDKLQKGLNIVVMQDGKVKKIRR